MGGHESLKQFKEKMEGVLEWLTQLKPDDLGPREEVAAQLEKDEYGEEDEADMQQLDDIAGVEPKPPWEGLHSRASPVEKLIHYARAADQAANHAIRESKEAEEILQDVDDI